jgi:exosortase A-associated hydrolase 2
MTAPALPRAEALFLPAISGQRFCLYHAPAGDCHAALVYLHPFGDEMNKARRMVALQARALAAQGVAVLQIDLHGCGDSSGEFGDASWAGWKADAALAAIWLRARVQRPVGLWGLRLGALLALDCARDPAFACAELLLWQPVTSGSTFLTQFLRMKMANQMLAEGGEKSSTKVLREQLRSGDTMEVAGYDLTPAMADALDALDLAALTVTSCPVHWFEVVAEEGRPLSPVAARAVAAWQQAGVALQQYLVPGLPFWATQEISECPPLLAATCEALAEDLHAV